MKRETIVIGILVMLAAAGITVAAEDDLGVSFETTWVSKYIWRGIDRGNNKAAIQPSVNVDLYNTGFSANVWASYGCSGDTVNATEYDYSLMYSGTAFDDESTEIVYAASWIYYDFIDEPSSAADAQELNVSMAFPNLCPGGVVPSYTLIRMWGAESGGPSNNISGWIHVVGLDYALAVDGIVENNPEQVIDLSWDAVYNGSAGVAGQAGKAVDHDWSHMTFGVSTAFELTGAGTITPGLYYQVSMDDSVNKSDEFWTGISYSLDF